VGSHVENNGGTTAGGVTGRGFEKGRSGNPGGRPRGIARLAREIVGDDGEKLVHFWVKVMDGDPLPNGRVPTVSESLAASKLLAERGWGKPAEFVPIEDADPLQMWNDDAARLKAAFDETMDELARRRKAASDVASST
jgi:hypothetical protein